MQEIDTGERKMTPKERTRQLFALDVEALKGKLQDHIVIDPLTEKGVRLTDVEAWKEIGNRWWYAGVELTQKGNVWTPHRPPTDMSQTLIIGKKIGQRPGCVRVKRVTYLNLDTEEYVPELGEFGQREGDIAKFFGLQPYEIARLEYQDDSGVLWLVRTGETIGGKQKKMAVDPEQANTNLDRFIQE